MSNRGGTTLKIILGILLSVGLLLGIAFYVDWPKVMAHVSNMSYLAMLPVLVICFLQFIARTYRWRLLLPNNQQEKVALWDLWDCISIGNLATQVLPLRAGEFLRPLMLSRISAYSFTTSFVSVVVERFFDLSAVLLSFALMLYFVGEVNPLLYKGAFALGILATVLFVFLILGSISPQSARTCAKFGCKYLPEKLSKFALHLCDQLLTGLEPLRDIGKLSKIILWTITVWILTYLFYELFLPVFYIPAPYGSGIVIGVVVALAVAAPSAPGFAGVFEGGVIIAFALLGLDANLAAAYGIVSHVFQFIFCLIFGFLSLLRQGVGLRELTKQRSNTQISV